MIDESIFPVFFHRDKDREMKKKEKDVDKQVKNETDALPTALTRLP